MLRDSFKTINDNICSYDTNSECDTAQSLHLLQARTKSAFKENVNLPLSKPHFCHHSHYSKDQ